MDEKDESLVFVTIWDCRTHVPMTSSVERTDLDFKISVALIIIINNNNNMGRDKRIWYLSPMRAAKVQASLRIRAVSPEPPLLAHTSNESRGTFRQKAKSLAPLNGWACAVKICHDGMLEDTNSLDAPHIIIIIIIIFLQNKDYSKYGNRTPVIVVGFNSDSDVERSMTLYKYLFKGSYFELVLPLMVKINAILQKA